MAQRISDLKFQISHRKSLCSLCVLCVSVVILLTTVIRASAVMRLRSQERAASKEVKAGAAYKPSNGPYAVGSVEDLVLRDRARGKDLPVAVRYPKTDAPGEKFP